MMIGTYLTTLTENRRVAVPKKFREELGKKFIIARWYEGCLVMVSNTKWQELLDRLTGKAKFITTNVRDTDRFIMGSAYELKPDSQGRVILPNGLALYAGIKSEAAFIGLGDRVEVWDKENWEKRESKVALRAAELVEAMAYEAKGDEKGHLP